MLRRWPWAVSRDRYLLLKHVHLRSRSFSASPDPAQGYSVAHEIGNVVLSRDVHFGAEESVIHFASEIVPAKLPSSPLLQSSFGVDSHKEP